MVMEEKIRTAVRGDYVLLKGFLLYATEVTCVWIHGFQTKLIKLNYNIERGNHISL